MAKATNWLAILAAFALGVTGAVQVGRVAPVASFVQQDLKVDLITIGWLVSLITMASAILGLIAGHWVVRRGLRASLVFGSLVLFTCAVGAAFATSVPMLIAARMIEGLGYLAIVVAAPTLIARDATPKDAPFALALWGTFFTLGLSLASFAGGAVSEAFGWRVWFVTSAGLVLLAGVAALWAVREDGNNSAQGAGLWRTITAITPASWLLGAAFLGLTLLSLSILSLFPAFLIQEHGIMPGVAGSVTGGIALASIAGSLSYGFLARHLHETVIASGASFALIIAVFPAFTNGYPPDLISAFAAIAVFMSGVLVAQTFSAVPKVAGSLDLIGPSNGLIAQLGSVGALIGPPMVGAIITVADWGAVPLVVTGFGVCFALLFGLAMRAHGSGRAAPPRSQ